MCTSECLPGDAEAAGPLAMSWGAGLCCLSVGDLSLHTK